VFDGGGNLFLDDGSEALRLVSSEVNCDPLVTLPAEGRRSGRRLFVRVMRPAVEGLDPDCAAVAVALLRQEWNYALRDDAGQLVAGLDIPLFTDERCGFYGSASTPWGSLCTAAGPDVLVQPTGGDAELFAVTEDGGVISLLGIGPTDLDSLVGIAHQVGERLQQVEAQRVYCCPSCAYSASGSLELTLRVKSGDGDKQDLVISGD
jgi:hypothetical protein